MSISVIIIAADSPRRLYQAPEMAPDLHTIYVSHTKHKVPFTIAVYYKSKRNFQDMEQ
jgi:hypothetical protein